MSNFKISWEQFAICNPNSQTAFEQMCRWLFNDFFFDGKALLHSDPNNPGIEVLPELHMASNKRISFQAKFFSSLDYEQIKHSARKTVEYYSGKLDVVYLYCNKDVTVTSEGYRAVTDILHTAGIDLVPITNQAILEQVMKNETILWYYFNERSLQLPWFQEQLRSSLDSLGPRYNDKFNVTTVSEELFDYFLCSADAVSRINANKNELIEKLINNQRRHRSCRDILRKILSEMESLVDVTEKDVLTCFSWCDLLKSHCASEFSQIEELVEKKKVEMSKAYEKKERARASEISEEVDELCDLLSVPELILPENDARNLMCHQIVVVKGNAGVGKSQMFAVAAEKLIQAKRGALLLLGNSYLNDHAIMTQTTEILAIDLSLEAIMHKLEGLAIQDGTYSYIFIDAVNESTYKNIWKNGLQLLFSKVKKYPHIKAAISVRTGYEKIVFNDAVNKAIVDGAVASIVHNGFQENSINATLTFLNYYGIPFLPSYFLQSEMTNPLFLKIFCETYTGENSDLFSLFDRLIEKAGYEAQTAIGIEDQLPILGSMVDELASIRIAKDFSVISQADLFEMAFWDRYGLSAKKIPFVSALERSGLLTSMAIDGAESYLLGYNLLEDFVCAKAIIGIHQERSKLISYLQNDLLKIEKGKIEAYHNIDIFIAVCGLFADRYHGECFEDVVTAITDDFDKRDIAERYLQSFMWRKASSVNADTFLGFLRKYPVDANTAFRVLIENSTKEHHPLNAFFLHDMLLKNPLAQRDALWTTFINSLADEEERVFQLIVYFDEGNQLDGLSCANAELLLILLTWLLTSSNRFLRDKASKAAIELLKRYFSLSKKILCRFEKVDDPYVLQRLHGIIFGACVKRTEANKDAFKELVEYIYATIFNQEYVYPDILLRDYARLTIERWRYEYPDDDADIELEKIIPPYNSIPIPIVERQKYYKPDSVNSGFNSIDRSMRINHADCPGCYGDFGRYTFQAALEHFEGVDVVNLYHYAMQYIRDNLGYNKYLGEYDRSSTYYRYNRNETKKSERIGKKYQWIAFYNILARVSDRHLLKEWGEESYCFQGPWDPYVRDFDPTLNVNCLVANDVPEIILTDTKEEFLPLEPEPEVGEIEDWKITKPKLFETISDQLLLHDTNDTSWAVLYLYDCAKNKIPNNYEQTIGFVNGSQQIWLTAQSYFVTPSQFETVKQHVMSSRFSPSEFPEGDNVYQLFNREYAWSPGYRSLFKKSWIDYEIDSGEYRIEKEIFEIPDFEHIEYDDNGEKTIPTVKKVIERKVPEDVIHVQIMPTYSRVLWEEQYDASQDKATAFYIPCGKIIEYFGLKQNEADGYFYSKDGVLVCFDGCLSGAYKGLLIRADFLEEYLKNNDVQMIWTCLGEKQYFKEDLYQMWSSWKGCYYIENGKVCGNIEVYERTY